MSCTPFNIENMRGRCSSSAVGYRLLYSCNIHKEIFPLCRHKDNCIVLGNFISFQVTLQVTSPRMWATPQHICVCVCVCVCPEMSYGLSVGPALLISVRTFGHQDTRTPGRALPVVSCQANLMPAPSV